MKVGDLVKNTHVTAGIGLVTRIGPGGNENPAFGPMHLYYVEWISAPIGYPAGSWESMNFLEVLNSVDQ